MRRPLLCFAAFVAAYLAVIGWSWLPQALTGGELAGHAAKTQAILQLLASGDFAWFPDYLSGSPAATLLSFALSIPVYAPALWLMPDPLAAMKSTALVLLTLGGFAAFAFGRRLAGNGCSGFASGWHGFAVGCAWMLAPQVILRAGMLEHMTVLVAVPLVPLTFLALLRVAARGTVFDAVLLAVAWSATMLAWSKMGATLVIPLLIFAAWLFASRPECRMNLLRGAMWSTPLALLLGVVPLLPLLRERAFMTVFDLDPFASWQAMYSVKSATAWFDRGGELFASLPRIFRIDEGAYYLGLVGLAAVAVTIFLTWRSVRLPREVAAIRIFLFIALVMFWLSFGPRSVIQGHFELLAGAQHFPDFAIVLHWLALAAQGVFLFWCMPRGRWRLQAFVAVFAIYLFVPVFRIAEKLPLYGDLRAPDSFWALNGSFAWAVASALAIVFVLQRLAVPRLRVALAACVLALACLDLSVNFGWFRRGGLEAATISDYEQTAKNLNSSTGRVLPITRRYFPLDLPQAAGRPLSTESLNRYLMPRDMARLQTAARLSADNMLAYFRVGGIGSVLVANDAAPLAKKWFRSLLPAAFENDSFVVLSNPRSLHPGFFASAAVPASGGLDEYRGALEAARNGILTLAPPPAQPLPQAVPGAFERLETATPRSSSRIEFAAPGRTGWIVLSESWHPDWTGLVDGRAVPIFRAAGAFPAVEVETTSKRVEFRFRPPAWYGLCLATGGLSWLAALGFLGLARFLPARWHEPARTAPAEISITERPAITRPLALVPTYNESASIDDLLARLLESNPNLHALVIDDNSPDGTAARVRAHADFGSRLHLLERSAKLGLGSAYREGFRWALDRDYDACVEIDADLSHDPADISRLIDALDAGADAAIGSRYLDGLRVVNWPRHRLLLSTGASRYVRLLTGLPLTDATSGFKALRRQALEHIDWSHLRADGYGFQVELHWLLWKAGLKLVEVPIVFTERRAGATKMTAGIAVEAAWRTLQLAIIDTPRRRDL